jgi:hypothetical protein
MASTYSPSLRIELIGAGDQAGTWNTTTNSNLGTIIESAIAGYVAVSVTSANQAFTALDGAADQARNAVIALTTTTGANFAVYAPPQEKTYVIYNTTAFTATIYNSTVLGNTTAAGAGINVPAGKKLLVFSDGTNFYTIESANLTGVLAVVNGGTGVTTSTGTGNTVLSASPTLVTPILGTPTSGNLANCTFPTLNQNTTGTAAGLSATLAVASGGTGVTTSTGSGNNVLSTSPTLVTPALGTPTSGNLANCTFPTLNQNTTGSAATVTTTVNSGATGTTQSYGTNNTRIATTAFVQAALQLIYPVGSIYTNASNATNPATLFGFGAWSLFSLGRVLVGYDGGAFNPVGATGGNANATLPSHTHTATVSDPGHNHQITSNGINASLNQAFTGNGQGGYTGGQNVDTVLNTGQRTTLVTVTNSTEGASATNANLQPYIVVYMWQRTS